MMSRPGLSGRAFSAITVTLAAAYPHGAAEADCGMRWYRGYAIPGSGFVTAGSTISSAIEWDPDGAGLGSTSLVVSGPVNSAAGGANDSIVNRWDGERWIGIGPGNFQPTCLAVHAGELVAAGYQQIMRWSGSAWITMASVNGYVYALCSHDGELYAAGEFSMPSGGSPYLNIARWDGLMWQPVGEGLNGGVKALTAYQGDLVAGGNFTASGLTDTPRIARWDGAQWHALGTGMDYEVCALAEYNDSLIAGGRFMLAGATAARKIAQWNGQAWSALGDGILSASGNHGGGSGVLALTVYDGKLYAGGDFYVHRHTYGHLATWDGSEWSYFDPGTNYNLLGFATFRGELIAVGDFQYAGIATVNNVARWNGQEFRGFGQGVSATETPIRAFERHADRLVAVGNFGSVGGIRANRVAGWDGRRWHQYGTGIQHLQDSTPYCLAEFRGDLIVGGAFNGLPYAVNRWDGNDWVRLGAGFSDAFNSRFDTVYAMVSHNDNLFAGGNFTSVAGQTANRIARWDGTAWSPVGDGVSGTIYALLSYGDDVIVGGSFTSAGGTPAARIARWSAAEGWRPLGDGFNGLVYDLTIYAGEIIAAGIFATSGQTSVRRIARWDGTSWQPLGTGFSGNANAVNEVTTYRGELVAVGSFNNAGGNPASCIAFWNGEAWRAVAALPTNPPYVHAAAEFQNELYVGGDFTQIDGIKSNKLARWGPSFPSDLDHDRGIGLGDLTIFLSNFGTTGGAAASDGDSDEDGDVDLSDLTVLLARYGTSCE